MTYRQYSPSQSLLPFVHSFYSLENTQLLNEPLEVTSIPSGLGGMVFNFGDPGYALQEKGVWERTPFCFAAGQFTKNYSLQFKGKIGMVGVAFYPIGLAKILGTPLKEFTDTRIDLNLVLGKEAACLEQKILSCRSNFERVKVLEGFLEAKILKLKSKPDIIEQAIAEIQYKKGILSINKLSDDLCISPRQFRRRFIEVVGISPKMCARIKRFNYITHLSLNHFEKWMDMVHEGGYYDQAHFIRDLSDFTGKKPKDFINYNRKLALLVGA